MKQRANSYNMDIVAALVLFCIFSMAVFLVLITGVNVHRETTATIESNYQNRTALAYISEKIRHYDSEFGIEIKPYGEGQGIFLYETIDGDEYETIIYCSQGSLKELFKIKDISLDPETGFDIIPVQHVRFNKIHEGQIIEIRMTGVDGRESRFLISPRAEGVLVEE